LKLMVIINSSPSSSTSADVIYGHIYDSVLANITYNNCIYNSFHYYTMTEINKSKKQQTKKNKTKMTNAAQVSLYVFTENIVARMIFNDKIVTAFPS